MTTLNTLATRLLASGLLMLTSCGAGPPAPIAPTGAPLRVTPTPYPGGDGYQCAFHLKSEPNTESIVFWALPGGLITINGKSIPLKESGVERHIAQKDKLSPGDRLDMRFAAEATRVEVQATVSETCPPDHPGCELYRYNASITVNHANASTTLEAVGECGS